MKITSFITSIILLIITTVYLIGDITNFGEFGDYIFKGIQLILILICVTGIIMNWPVKLLRSLFFRSPAL